MEPPPREAAMTHGSGSGRGRAVLTERRIETGLWHRTWRRGRSRLFRWFFDPVEHA